MRGFYEPVTMADKIISCASYLTGGLVGLIWLIVLAFQRATMKEFLKFHVMQSIFISIILVIFRMVLNAIFNVVANIPGANVIVEIFAGILSFPVFGLPLFSLVVTLIMLYCAITSLMGKYSYIPWVSDNIRQMN